MLRDNDKNDKTYWLLELPLLEGLHVPIVIVYRMLDFESSWVLLDSLSWLSLSSLLFTMYWLFVPIMLAKKKKRINHMGVLLRVQIYTRDIVGLL